MRQFLSSSLSKHQDLGMLSLLTYWCIRLVVSTKIRGVELYILYKAFCLCCHGKNWDIIMKMK